MKAVLRKFRHAKREGACAPVLELCGETVTLTDLREHFRKKPPKGRPLDALPTPTRSEAPTPLGLREVRAVRQRSPQEECRLSARALCHPHALSSVQTVDANAIWTNVDSPCHDELLKWSLNDLRGFQRDREVIVSTAFNDIGPLELSPSHCDEETIVARALTYVKYFLSQYRHIVSSRRPQSKDLAAFTYLLQNVSIIENFANQLDEMGSSVRLPELLRLVEELRGREALQDSEWVIWNDSVYLSKGCNSKERVRTHVHSTITRGVFLHVVTRSKAASGHHPSYLANLHRLCDFAHKRWGDYGGALLSLILQKYARQNGQTRWQLFATDNIQESLTKWHSGSMCTSATDCLEYGGAIQW